jgi:hypothetical protein
MCVNFSLVYLLDKAMENKDNDDCTTFNRPPGSDMDLLQINRLVRKNLKL